LVVKRHGPASRLAGDSDVKKILGGATYVNIHTPKNAAGEIRGQIASS
jgi:hypothetical protein